MKLLTTEDMAGAHNGDLAASCARLIRGGSWKKQRIVVLIPASDLIPTKVALAIWNLAFPPNNGVVRIAAVGMEVGDAYSTAIAQVLADPNLSQWEYLLTIEHDNLPPSDGVLRLVERMEMHPEMSCIGGLYWTKGPGGVPQIWGDVRDPVPNYRPQLPDPNGGLVECVGTGMGFNLWRLSMFKDERLRRPWFKTQADATGVGTQDLYFWSDARKYGYRCAVDCGVRVGHYDLKGEFGQEDFVW
jgi:hypothetical protein